MYRASCTRIRRGFAVLGHSQINVLSCTAEALEVAGTPFSGRSLRSPLFFIRDPSCLIYIPCPDTARHLTQEHTFPLLLSFVREYGEQRHGTAFTVDFRGP